MPRVIEAALIDIARDSGLTFDDKLTLLKELRRSLPPEANRHVFRYIVIGVCVIAALPPSLLAWDGLQLATISDQTLISVLQVSSAAVGALAAYFTSRNGGIGAPVSSSGTTTPLTVESTIVEVSRDRTLSVEQRCILIEELRNWLPPEQNRWSFAFAASALCCAAGIPPLIIAGGAVLGWSTVSSALPAVLQVSATALGALAAYLVVRRISPTST